MIELNGKQYELTYNIKRIELIEKATEQSVYQMLAKTNGLLSILELRTYLSYGLREVGANSLLDISQANKLVEKMFEELNYIDLCTEVIESVQRDCPFLFRES